MAGLIEGTVMRVIDGDTAVVQMHVRIADRNADELGNPAGDLAKGKLIRAIGGRTILFRVLGADKFDRALVVIDGLPTQ